MWAFEICVSERNERLICYGGKKICDFFEIVSGAIE